MRGWGVNSLEDARHWIGLLQYNPSTSTALYMLQGEYPFTFSFHACMGGEKVGGGGGGGEVTGGEEVRGRRYYEPEG